MKRANKKKSNKNMAKKSLRNGIQNKSTQAQDAEQTTDHRYLKIGSHLRHARLVRGLRLRELAGKVNCSESLLSKIENDKVQPSLRMLHRILAHLDTSIGSLFSQQDDHERIVMRAGKRELIPTGTNRLRKNVVGVKLEWLIPYPESKLLSGAIHIVTPGGGSEGCIAHVGEEVGYILEGELELTVENKNYRLQSGDSFFFPSDLLHGYRNPGKTETRIIWINTPPTF